MRKGHIQRGRVENTMEISPEGEEEEKNRRKMEGIALPRLYIGKEKRRREKEREEEREMYATFNKTEFQKGEGREGEK